MKVTFSFHNGSARIFLEPENSREERYLELCKDSHDEVRIVGSNNPKALFLELTQRKLEE